MKKYKVLKPVSDSKDNHKHYRADSTIKLDKARADVLLERGIIRELTEDEEAEEATQSEEQSKEDKETSVTKESKEKGKTKGAQQ